MIIQRQLSPPKPLPKQPIRTPPYHKFSFRVYRNFADKLQRWQELPARQACRIAEGRAFAAAPDYVPLSDGKSLIAAAIQAACAHVVTAAAATEENQDQNNPQTGVSSLRTSAHLTLHLLFCVHFIICVCRFLVPAGNKKTPRLGCFSYSNPRYLAAIFAASPHSSAQGLFL